MKLIKGNISGIEIEYSSKGFGEYGVFFKDVILGEFTFYKMYEKVRFSEDTFYIICADIIDNREQLMIFKYEYIQKNGYNLIGYFTELLTDIHKDFLIVKRDNKVHFYSDIKIPVSPKVYDKIHLTIDGKYVTEHFVVFESDKKQIVYSVERDTPKMVFYSKQNERVEGKGILTNKIAGLFIVTTTDDYETLYEYDEGEEYFREHSGIHEKYTVLNYGKLVNTSLPYFVFNTEKGYVFLTDTFEIHCDSIVFGYGCFLSTFNHELLYKRGELYYIKDTGTNITLGVYVKKNDFYVNILYGNYIDNTNYGFIEKRSSGAFLLDNMYYIVVKLVGGKDESFT